MCSSKIIDQSTLMRLELVEAPHIDVLIARAASDRDERYLPAAGRDRDLSMATL